MEMGGWNQYFHLLSAATPKRNATFCTKQRPASSLQLHHDWTQHTFGVQRQRGPSPLRLPSAIKRSASAGSAAPEPAIWAATTETEAVDCQRMSCMAFCGLRWPEKLPWLYPHVYYTFQLPLYISSFYCTLETFVSFLTFYYAGIIGYTTLQHWLVGDTGRVGSYCSTNWLYISECIFLSRTHTHARALHWSYQSTVPSSTMNWFSDSSLSFKYLF